MRITYPISFDSVNRFEGNRSGRSVAFPLAVVVAALCLPAEALAKAGGGLPSS
jgi:hypothetical protein